MVLFVTLALYSGGSVFPSRVQVANGCRPNGGGQFSCAYINIFFNFFSFSHKYSLKTPTKGHCTCTVNHTSVTAFRFVRAQHRMSRFSYNSILQNECLLKVIDLRTPFVKTWKKAMQCQLTIVLLSVEFVDGTVKICWLRTTWLNSQSGKAP